MLRSTGLQIQDKKSKAPNYIPPPPKDSDTYPILTNLGLDYWPDDTQAFEDLTNPVQFAYAAHRDISIHSEILEQKQDYFVIVTQTPASQSQYGSWHGASATNHNFISHYYQGPGYATYGKAAIDASWRAYLNWVLNINDGNSHGSWNGTEAGVQSYKY